MATKTDPAPFPLIPLKPGTAGKPAGPAKTLELPAASEAGSAPDLDSVARRKPKSVRKSRPADIARGPVGNALDTRKPRDFYAFLDTTDPAQEGQRYVSLHLVDRGWMDDVWAELDAHGLAPRLLAALRGADFDDAFQKMSPEEALLLHGIYTWFLARVVQDGDPAPVGLLRLRAPETAFEGGLRPCSWYTLAAFGREGKDTPYPGGLTLLGASPREDQRFPKVWVRNLVRVADSSKDGAITQAALKALHFPQVCPDVSGTGTQDAPPREREEPFSEEHFRGDGRTWVPRALARVGHALSRLGERLRALFDEPPWGGGLALAGAPGLSPHALGPLRLRAHGAREPGASHRPHLYIGSPAAAVGPGQVPNPMTPGGGGVQPFVGVLDIGQGGCNVLYDNNGHAIVYFDAGYPENFLGSLPVPFPAPCFCNDPLVILSHWDIDHSMMPRYDHRMYLLRWLVPQQHMGTPETKEVVARVLEYGGEMHLWVAGPGSQMRFPWGFVERAAGPHPFKSDEKNNSGLVMYVCVQDSPPVPGGGMPPVMGPPAAAVLPAVAPPRAANRANLGGAWAGGRGQLTLAHGVDALRGVLPDDGEGTIVRTMPIAVAQVAAQMSSAARAAAAAAAAAGSPVEALAAAAAAKVVKETSNDNGANVARGTSMAGSAAFIGSVVAAAQAAKLAADTGFTANSTVWEALRSAAIAAAAMLGVPAANPVQVGPAAHAAYAHALTGMSAVNIAAQANVTPAGAAAQPLADAAHALANAVHPTVAEVARDSVGLGAGHAGGNAYVAMTRLEEIELVVACARGGTEVSYFARVSAAIAAAVNAVVAAGSVQPADLATAAAGASFDAAWAANAVQADAQYSVLNAANGVAAISAHLQGNGTTAACANVIATAGVAAAQAAALAGATADSVALAVDGAIAASRTLDLTNFFNNTRHQGGTAATKANQFLAGAITGATVTAARGGNAVAVAAASASLYVDIVMDALGFKANQEKMIASAVRTAPAGGARAALPPVVQAQGAPNQVPYHPNERYVLLTGDASFNNIYSQAPVWHGNGLPAVAPPVVVGMTAVHHGAITELAPAFIPWAPGSEAAHSLTAAMAAHGAGSATITVPVAAALALWLRAQGHVLSAADTATVAAAAITAVSAPPVGGLAAIPGALAGAVPLAGHASALAIATAARDAAHGALEFARRTVAAVERAAAQYGAHVANNPFTTANLRSDFAEGMGGAAVAGVATAQFFAAPPMGWVWPLVGAPPAPQPPHANARLVAVAAAAATAATNPSAVAPGTLAGPACAAAHVAHFNAGLVAARNVLADRKLDTLLPSFPAELAAAAGAGPLRGLLCGFTVYCTSGAGTAAVEAAQWLRNPTNLAQVRCDGIRELILACSWAPGNPVPANHVGLTTLTNAGGPWTAAMWAATMGATHGAATQLGVDAVPVSTALALALAPAPPMPPLTQLPLGNRIAYSYGVGHAPPHEHYYRASPGDLGHPHPVAVAHYEAHGWTGRLNTPQLAHQSTQPDNAHPHGHVALGWESGGGYAGPLRGDGGGGGVIVRNPCVNCPPQRFLC
ncbi:hypothetical protein HPC49_04315 [Pyxidicoccus fallax]|uniref:Uncharacterized protein n=1 Tax=Pyxidicoccus fallax TaxID=394095 RepID=A0A848L816_9BACT|nr:hypothetical protein [Pyxidicoccus fallax]NMO15130.1 hypothetical protein [Pyxidicoccus fallax]NPC77476.1 hypothetical protein [Pyxidicoccus fallax]